MNERLIGCLALVAIFQIGDREITEEEVAFIGRVASDLGLTDEELEELKRSLNKKQDFRQLLSTVTSKELKRFILRRIVGAVLLDGKIAKEEETILSIVKEVFKLEDNLFKEYIEWMKEGVKWEQKGEILLSKLIS